MPAQSEAQRKYLNMRFGHKWVKKHGYDNKGKLPAHAKKRKQGSQEDMVRQFMNRRKRGRSKR
jgi:hypothetical protein